MDVKELEGKLLKSHWPKCNAFAEELAAIGTDEAKKALVSALKAKRHHIRTASIKALTSFGDSVAEIIEPFLGDPAYETRMETKKAIKNLTGKDVTTAQGE